MPPTISQTKLQVRQTISQAFSDLITFTAASGSTTSVTATGAISARPAGSLIGAELSSTSGTGLGQSVRITGHTVSGATTTLSWPAVTAMGNDTVCEIHKIDGQGFYKIDYDNAINAAIDMMADQVFTDTELITLACERGYGVGSGAGGTVQGLRRAEYPFPSASFNWLWGVDIQAQAPMTGHATGNMTDFENLGDVTGRTQVAQSFQIQQESLIQFVTFYIGEGGSAAIDDNITCAVQTDSAGLPSGTAVTFGTTTTVAYTLLGTRPRYVVFQFDPPLLLQANTIYWAVLARSGSVSATKYFTVGRNTANTYGYGNLAEYGGAVWTATTTTSLIFAVSVASIRWLELAAANWAYQTGSPDTLRLRKFGVEGTPIRLRGGAAIARPTAETSVIAVRPEWVAQYAEALLRGNSAGIQGPDNEAQAASVLTGRLGLLPLPAQESSWE